MYGEPIEEEPRLQDLLEAIEFGNHKSATKDGPKLLSIFGKEVENVGSCRYRSPLSSTSRGQS